jgi:hypothetical protein
VWPPPDTVQPTTWVPPTPPVTIVRLENSVVMVSPGPGGQRSAARQNSAVSVRERVRPRSSPFGPRCRDQPPSIGDTGSAVPWISIADTA